MPYMSTAKPRAPRGVTEEQLRAKIIAMCKETSQAAVAEKFGVGCSYMNDLTRGRRPISDTIARKLGYTLRVTTKKTFLPTAAVTA